MRDMSRRTRFRSIPRLSVTKAIWLCVPTSTHLIRARLSTTKSVLIGVITIDDAMSVLGRGNTEEDNLRFGRCRGERALCSDRVIKENGTKQSRFCLGFAVEPFLTAIASVDL